MRRLLDLFCKAGGCTKGYQQAGFYVVGVDIDSQPRYVGDEFYQADALEFVSKYGHKFDVIHASPPCQAYSVATPIQHRSNHDMLIDDVRKLLRATGKPYVIENVENARKHLINPVKICGTMLGLPIWRHRYFEIWPEIPFLTPPCNHVSGDVEIDGVVMRAPVLCTGGGDGKRSNRKTHRPRGKVRDIRLAMRIPWMTQAELTEAIPPAYTQWIGDRLMEALR